MNVIWLAAATGDLEREIDYLLVRNPQAALRMSEAILHQVARLADYAHLGRVGRVEGTRELVIAGTPYIVAYYLKGSDVRILAVIHGKRKWPEGFDLH